MTEKYKYKQVPIDCTPYEEFTVTVVGNVDAGKSTTIGVLISNNELDDGNGLMRSKVVTHYHELTTGRTSDISHRYVLDSESKRVINYIDLAGHAKYLKTTINGLCSSTSDLSIICVSDNLPNIAREHIVLCLYLAIPFIIVFTKSDRVESKKRELIYLELNKLLSKFNKKRLYKITNEGDFYINSSDKKIPVSEYNNFVPCVETSNTVGTNITLLKALIRIYKKIPYTYDKVFNVEKVYIRNGVGIVVTGITGVEISVNDSLLLGPINGEFIPVGVRSIYNYYFHKTDKLIIGQRGCINITSKKIDHSMIKQGMILTPVIVPVYKTIKLNLIILHNSTTIKPGYNVVFNSFMTRRAVVIKDILNKEKMLRSGNKSEVVIEFKDLVYLDKSKLVVLREGNSRAIGRIILD